MKATLALSVDWQTHNLARSLAWQLHTMYGLSLDVCRLPPHVSLKQPFPIPSLEPMERYASALCPQIPSEPLRFSQVEAFAPDPASDILIVWFAVVEPPWLRALHTRLNTDMEALFGNMVALFDGEAYHFHLTVAIGPVEPPTRAAIIAAYHRQPLTLVASPTALALFVYDDAPGRPPEYITYQVLPLASASQSPPSYIDR